MLSNTELLLLLIVGIVFVGAGIAKLWGWW